MVTGIGVGTPIIPAQTITPARRWGGRVISASAVLFLLLDGGMKVAQATPALEASAQLGYAAGATFGLGVLLLCCLALYLIPPVAPLGAILLTGYLGGAMATHLRAGSPLFSLIFPAIIGALLWLGLFLRDARLRALLPR